MAEIVAGSKLAGAGVRLSPRWMIVVGNGAGMVVASFGIISATPPSV